MIVKIIIVQKNVNNCLNVKICNNMILVRMMNVKINVVHKNV